MQADQWHERWRSGRIGFHSGEVARPFFSENGIRARRVIRDAFTEYRAPGLRLLCGDLFHLTPQLLEGCTAVYDRAALIALPLELQGDYALKVAQLTSRGTQTLLITLEYPQHEMRGPPYSVDSDAVDRLCSAHQDICELERVDIWASDPLRSRGITQLGQVCYHLTQR
jgi:thiopurine S-methyltransferase